LSFKLDAHIYHYGWVRPPDFMKKKIRFFKRNHHGRYKDQGQEEKNSMLFNYGDLSRLPMFKGTHPQVMNEWIEDFNWAEELLDFTEYPEREKHKHEKIRNIILTFVEQNILQGKQIGGFKNYKLLS